MLFFRSKPETLTEVGSLGLVSYERISREVILVPVNGAQCPQNAQYIKDELNRIYAPAIVSWSVKLADSLHVDNLQANGFGSSEMNAFSRYTPNMRKLTRAFKKTGQKEKHTLVLFFIADNSVDFTGFMPLSSDFGFIFNFGSESEVLAHELAHGAFNLRHTFSTKAKYPLAKKTTRNLMDYTQSSELWKYQWDRIHNPESIFFSAYDEDEGAAYGNPSTHFLCINDTTAINALNKKYQVFYLPNNKIVNLKGKYKVSGFFTDKDKTKNAPGAISNLRIKGYDYYHHYEPGTSISTGYGFKYNDSETGSNISIDNFELLENSTKAVRVFIDTVNNKLIVNGFDINDEIAFNGDCKCNYKDISKCDDLYVKTQKDDNAIGHEFTNPKNPFYDIVNENPCILNDLRSNPFYGIEVEQDWDRQMLGFKIIFGTGLAIIMAPIILEIVIAAGVEYGSIALKEALKKALKKRIKEMAIDASIQLSFNIVINTILAKESLTEMSYTELVKKSIKEINWIDVAMAPISNKIGDMSGKQGLGLNALWGCTSSFINNLELEGNVFVLNKSSGWELSKDCLQGAICESFSFVLSTNNKNRPKWVRRSLVSLQKVKQKIKKNPASFFRLCKMLNINIKQVEPIKLLLKSFGFTEEESMSILKRYCLPAGTPIYAEGKFFKKVENIEIGDKVDAMDSLGNIQLHKVVHLFTNYTSELAYIYSNGKQQLSLTPDHSVWTPNQWKRARDLVEGDSLLLVDHSFVFVDSVSIYNQSQTVYNFEVESAHNYFAGQFGILAHNNQCEGINDLLSGSYHSFNSRLGIYSEQFKRAIVNLSNDHVNVLLSKMSKWPVNKLDGFLKLFGSKPEFAKQLIEDIDLLSMWDFLSNHGYIRNHIEYLENLKIAFKLLPDRVDEIKAAIKDPKLKKGLKNLLEALGDQNIIGDKVKFDKFLKELSQLKKYAEFDTDFTLSLGSKVDNLIKVSKEHLGFGNLKDLAKNRQKLREACKKFQVGSPEYKKLNTKICNASEAIAEKRAVKIIKTKYPNAKDITQQLKPKGNGKQRQFDKVFKDPVSGRFIIIEAKGGSSPLGSAGGNQQGTDKYFEELLEYLKDADGISEDLIKQLKKAKNSHKLDYLLVKQKFNNKTGELLPTEIQKFKI